MFQCVRFQDVKDYFKNYSERTSKGVYFYRFINYNDKMQAFIEQYYKRTKQRGVFCQGKIPNPDKRQLSYFEEMLGLDFMLDGSFLDRNMKKWLPRLDAGQRNSICESMFHILDKMRQNGKNDNILKNAYIKFMCWFYYKFERILTQLGKEELPKILYEGYVSEYELKLLRILAGAGCDIVLLQYQGDEEYLKVDKDSQYSFIVPNENPREFPPDFSISNLQKEMEQRERMSIHITRPPERTVAANIWLTGDIFADTYKEPSERGDNDKLYYTVFSRVCGVENKGTYLNELFRFKMRLESRGRIVEVAEQRIPVPDAQEISLVKRSQYQNATELILNLSSNIHFLKSRELECFAKTAFTALMNEEAVKAEGNLNKLLNKAVYLICWMNRYLPRLFQDGNLVKIPVFLYYGACKDEKEALFLRFLSRLPADVLIFCPDAAAACTLEDNMLYEKKWEQSMSMGRFPKSIDEAAVGTVAFQAERELDSILYQDTGVYRNRQFKKAIPLNIQTTYEEIFILWEQEGKYRTGFEILDDRVIVPVIFTKVSGVPNEDTDAYWKEVSKLVVEDTYIISRLPYIHASSDNPISRQANSFLKGGELDVQKIKSHASYPYAFMREDMQDYMFDKLQQLISKRIINGTFTQGTEYTILSTILNLDKEFLRMIQRYDFTKEIPKLLIFSTGEELCSLEDSILAAYLNLIGFDIVIFTPTGYQSVERNFSSNIMMDHQIGEYMYDLRVPRFSHAMKSGQRETLMDKLFRRRK